MQELRYRLAARKGFWREYFFTGEVELRELSDYVKKGSIAVDVGGCIGSYAYHLSRFAKKVLVFEPNPEMARQIERLRIRNVVVEQIALSSSSGGTATLQVPMNADGQVSKGMASLETKALEGKEIFQSVSVPLRRLDDYGLENVSFIKIDVEGHEEAVLAGALETIRANNPTLLIECEERHNPGGLERIKETLSDLGYEGFFFDSRERKSIRDFDCERDQNADVAKDKLMGAKIHRRSARYINNFLFRHR
ncbi:MAG: FkbM family methyltransferase [Methylocystis sp.]